MNDQQNPKIKLPPIDVSDAVVNKIKTEKIKMTERWVFWAKKLGLSSGLTLTILILIFIINLILYYIQSHDLIYYLDFGWPALTFILKKLPFIYFTIALFLLVIINFFINKTGLIYKKYYHLLIIIIWCLIIGSGLFLFFTDINGYFERQVALSQKRIFLLSEIYQGTVPCLSTDKVVVIGKVIEKNQSGIIIQTLDKQKKITVIGPDDLFADITLGKIVVALGTKGETFFAANKVKVVTPEMFKDCINQL